jgi:chemotaxis protein MotA
MKKKKQKSFALTTFLGLAGGLLCVGTSIAEGGMENVGLFVNIPSLLIIVGGTICVLVMSFPFSVLKRL